MDYNNQFDYWNNIWNGKIEENGYPETECKATTLTFWNCTFGILFGLGFCSLPVFFLYVLIVSDFNVRGIDSFGDRAFCVGLLYLFICIGTAIFILSLRNIYRFFLVRKRGESMQGVVLGYENENAYYNGVQGQVCKIVIDTIEGRKLIKYRLGDTTQPYLINETVDVQNYKNIYYVKKKD